MKNRLTTITAGPGYGKTTLAVQALKQVKARIVWLRLDKTDSNLVTFLTCLAKGIQKVVPEFTPPDPEDCQSILLDQPADETHFRQLLAELEAYLDQDLVLVLDECHWIQGSDAVNAALTFFLRQAPSAFHMVLISRASVPLSFSRLKAQRQVLEITSADLAFSCEEAALLFTACFQAGWDSDLIERIWALTQGWVSGLTLFHYAFHDSSMDAIRSFLDQPDPLPPAIADYLEEEVFSPLASETKNFLVRTSILARLQADFCDEFLGINDSESMLRHLASIHMVIHQGRHDGGGYVYHRLFGLFLRKKLLAFSSTETIAGLRRKAAGLYQGKGRIGNALGHFLAAADYKEVACLLNTDGRRLFQEGKYEILKTCLDTLPDAYIDDLPWVLCLYGKVQGVLGNPGEATQAYDRALAIFTQQDDSEGICLCRIETALNHYFAGQFAEAARGLEDLLTRPAISDELRIEALGYLIFMTTQFRHKDSWRRYYEICQSTLAYLDSVGLGSCQKVWLDIYRGHACLATGDNEKALEIGRSIEWLRQQEGLDDFYAHYVLAASACNSLGRHQEGMTYARKGLAGLARKNTSLGFSVPAWQPARLTPAGIRDRGRQDTTLPFMLLLAAK
ncbi:MAG: hypothetical protein P8X55_15770, partial [Desulfosarcinaceae bacterium]